MDEFEKLTSKPLLAGPKRHHYVSEFYLNGFTDGTGGLHVFDRKDATIRPQVPKDTAVIGHFYTFIDKQDRRRFEIERLFGIVEGRTGPAIKTLEGGGRLSQEEREHLSLFMGMTAMRTPAALEEAREVRAQVHRAEVKLRMSSEQQAYRMLREYLPPNTPEETVRKHAADAFEMALEGRFSVNVPDELARQESLKLWAPVAEILYNRDWTLVEAPNGCEYLTSDSPVVLVPLQGTEDQPLGYASLHAHVLFPLTRTLALVMNGDEGRFRRQVVRPEQVHRFNLSVAADCHRFVIGTKQEAVRRVVNELALAGTSWKPRTDVGVGKHPEDGGPAIWIRGRGKRATTGD